MIIAALLLLVIVAAVVLWLLAGADGSQKFELDAVGIGISMNALTVFLLGAACMLLALLAVWMIKSGSKRGVRRRRERKDLEQRAQAAEDERLTAEQDRQTAVQEKDRADVTAARDRVAARDAEREREAEMNLHLEQEQARQSWDDGADRRGPQAGDRSGAEPAGRDWQEPRGATGGTPVADDRGRGATGAGPEAPQEGTGDRHGRGLFGRAKDRLDGDDRR